MVAWAAGGNFAPARAGQNTGPRNMSHQKFMQRALDIALERMRANMGGPFGAVIVRDGEIIAEGWNEVTSTNDPTAHAEVVAIRRACAKLATFNLANCDIYAR